MSYVYEIARTSGLPNGFAFRWDTLTQLTPDMTDCIVLPSLIDAPEGAIDAIRRLYEQGVSLIAVGCVDGLEDLFGVRYAPTKADICRICAPDGRSELIFPDQAEFFYAADGAAALLNAETPDHTLRPVLLRKGRALLMNAPTYELNHQTFPKHTGLSVGYQACLSTLLREAMSREMLALSRPTAVSDSCGVTLFRDTNGSTMLLAIDYSPYELDGTRREYQSTILLNDVSAEAVQSVYGPAPSVLRDESGAVRGLWLTLRQQECALIRLS